MGKWFGKIGYAETVETEPGIWEEQITERPYYGDVTSNRWKRQNSGEVNDNINLANVISIVADPFAYQNCSKIVYVEYMGTNWKVSDIDPQFPRLILTMGGVYNGDSLRVTE